MPPEGRTRGAGAARADGTSGSASNAPRRARRARRYEARRAREGEGGVFQTGRFSLAARRVQKSRLRSSCRFAFLGDDEGASRLVATRTSHRAHASVARVSAERATGPSTPRLAMDPPEVPPRAMTMTEVPRTEAYSKYNDAPGTGRTGMYAIPPNNYDFYTEEEKCVPRR